MIMIPIFIVNDTDYVDLQASQFPCGFCLPSSYSSGVRRYLRGFLYTAVFAAVGREGAMSYLMENKAETTPQVSPTERRHAGADQAEGKRQLHLLVVDDNQEVGETLALLLETFGHHVVVVRNWQMAAEQVKLRVPDAVYLDIEMPGISGIEIGRRLRNNPDTANAVLIAVTGHSLPMYMDDALTVGFRHFLVKPVRMEDLATTVESVLAG